MVAHYCITRDTPRGADSSVDPPPVVTLRKCGGVLAGLLVVMRPARCSVGSFPVARSALVPEG